MPSVATAPTPTATRRGDPTSFDESVQIVSILIERNKAGIPTRIDHPADVHIVYCRPGHKPAPDSTRPRGVLWVAANIHKDDKLRIKAKERQFPHFGAREFVLDGKHRVVSTGPARLPQKNTLVPKPNSAGQYFWSYSIELHHPDLHEPLEIDPTVIIDPEP